jgi:hypothetical protein
MGAIPESSPGLTCSRHRLCTGRESSIGSFGGSRALERLGVLFASFLFLADAVPCGPAHIP